MIWSCLDGSMGRAFAPAGQCAPRCAFAGGGLRLLAGSLRGAGGLAACGRRGLFILAPQNEGWAAAIEAAWGAKGAGAPAMPSTKRPEGFAPAALALCGRPAAGVELQPMGKEEYRQALASGWGAGTCAPSLRTSGITAAGGLGVAALQEGRLVAGLQLYGVPGRH